MSVICEEPLKLFEGEPKDLVGLEDAIGFVVVLGSGFTVGSGIGAQNWKAGNLDWEEEGTAVFGVSDKEPGKIVLGCSGVTAVRVQETVSVAVWRRVDTADLSGSCLSSKEWCDLVKRTDWRLKYCQQLFNWDHYTYLP